MYALKEPGGKSIQLEEGTAAEALKKLGAISGAVAARLYGRAGDPPSPTRAGGT